MSLFGGASKHYVDTAMELVHNKMYEIRNDLRESLLRKRTITENRLDAADTDRRRIKDNADKQGGMMVDLECRLNKLEDVKP